MSVDALPVPSIMLSVPKTPSITMSAPVTPIGSSGAVRFVREKSKSPTHSVVQGTLMVFINGLLADENEVLDENDSVTLTYFTSDV